MILVDYNSQRAGLGDPARQVVHVGSDFSTAQNPSAFIVVLPNHGTVVVGGQGFAVDVMAVVGAAAPIEITGDHVVVLVNP